MATKVLPLNTAELLISRQATLACVKCGESNWSKAQPGRQTKKPGFLTVRCKTCNSKAVAVCIKERRATDEEFREAQNAYSKASKKERWATDEAWREAQKTYKKERYATDEAWREAQKTYGKAYCKERYATDEEFREAKNAYGLQWAKDNPGKANAISAKRRATKLQATPPWSDLAAIAEFYDACPQGYHVDHVVPLQGELVCGLHVLANLQYLTASDNLSKSNSFNL